MGLLDFISGLFKPATDLIDSIHVSDAERMQLRNELAAIQSKAQEKFIELEKAKVDAHAKIVQSEMNSKNYLASSWRPLSSISLVIIVILGSFGVVTVEKELYDLLEMLLGVYAGSRGLEKITKTVRLGK